ncbi:MAG: T9SS type A sorting domain-containing protein [Lentimicrobiaceae bacterium]|nr:T9SS type A sorting domain-containing protein [Lentimicrobiaceae bacterium]
MCCIFIKIYLKEGNADITFYNTLGVAVKQSALNEGENIINADDLKAGIYIWKTPTSLTALITATSMSLRKTAYILLSEASEV